MNLMKSGAPPDTPYARLGSKLVDNGYSAIPCMPGSKFPGEYIRGAWYAKLGWNQYCDRLPTEYETMVWDHWPDAGICVVLDKTIKVIDIDTDDPNIRQAIVECLPDSPVKKRGAKGFSIFYQGASSIEPRGFNIGGQRVLDLLAYGKQTVIPPTIHPGTGKPYEWIGDPLDAVPPERLPTLPDDVVARLEAALSDYGYVRPIDRDVAHGDADTAWREVNDAALKNLSAWVPGMNLPGLRRSGQGYRAIASYRPSNSGKPESKRSANLSIHPDGIKDFGGDGTGMSPIDLVMITSSCPFQEAFEWLRDKLGLKPQMDFSRFIANSWAKIENPLVLPDEPDEPEPEPDEPVQRLPLRAPAREVDPFVSASHGGIMGAISQWMFDSAWRPVQEFATIGAIAVCAGLFGRRYITPTGLGLNLYLMGIAGSGFGKDHPLKATQALLADCGLQHLIGPGDFTSDSALEHVIRHRPCFVMPMDEFGVFLQATGGRSAGGYERRIRKLLLDIYTKGDGMWTGKQKAPQQGGRNIDNASEPVYNPTVTLLSMSTPTEFYAGLTDNNMSDGLVGRMTVIAPSKRPRPRDERGPTIPPKSLVAEVKRVAGQWPGTTGNLTAANWRMSGARPPLHLVPWASDASKRKWREIEEWQIGVIEDDESKDGIVGRAAEQTLKLATIRACSRDAMNPAVTEADIAWGWSVVTDSLSAIDAGTSQFMADGEFDRLCKAIVAHLQKAGGQMPKSALLRKKGMTKEPRLIKAAFDHLAAAGQIYPVIHAGNRVPPVRLI